MFPGPGALLSLTVADQFSVARTAPLRRLLLLFRDIFPELYVHEKGAVGK